MNSQRRGRTAWRGGWAVTALVAALGTGGAVRGADAQQVITQPEQTITIQVGDQAVITLPFDPNLIDIPPSNVASILAGPPLPPRNIRIIGTGIGVTSFIAFDQLGIPHLYRIQVAPNVAALQEQLNTLFPNAGLVATTSGGAIVVSGAVDNPSIVRRAIALAEATGATVINNIQAPTAEQVLLHVRFAEVTKSAVDRLGSNLFVTNVGEISDVVGDGSRTDIETLSEGIVRLFLVGENARLDAIITALKGTGEFRSLAEPNLVTLNGTEAQFLAGGEFPYPSVQAAGAGGGGGVVTIAFKQFGVLLTFTPQVTNSGTIQLALQSEVSSLDFGTGLTSGGFAIPSLLTRRAQTQVELGPGQHLAIAGLLDNSMSDAVDKIPVLGELPILGALFRSKQHLEDRTELLIVVTPYIVEPSNVAPRIPPGEFETWDWSRRMLPDTASRGRVMPQQRRSGGN